MNKAKNINGMTEQQAAKTGMDMYGAMMYVRRTPKLFMNGIRDPRLPLMLLCDISPMYIGVAPNDRANASPPTNLRNKMNQLKLKNGEYASIRQIQAMWQHRRFNS